MLVRDGASGLEVFTLQRVTSMVFAGGMTAFPGGSVDAGDGDHPIPWQGPEADWWANELRLVAHEARRHVVAAVRELYEETGVLLADSGGVAAQVPLGSARADLAGHRVSLAEVLRRRQLALRADLIRPWARWITPPPSPRRYDTFFFVAALPEGQDPDFETSEAVSGGWRRPVDVLAAGEAGEIGLMPPTIAVLTDLADAGSVQGALAATRAIDPITPTVLGREGDMLRVRAGGRDYVTRAMPGAARAAPATTRRVGHTIPGTADQVAKRQ